VLEPASPLGGGVLMNPQNIPKKCSCRFTRREKVCEMVGVEARRSHQACRVNRAREPPHGCPKRRRENRLSLQA